MILFIDNYDSFTYNLVQYVGEINSDVRVVRNDTFTLDDIDTLSPSHIIISPGPGTPDDAGLSMDVIKRFYKRVPILGVCLGHQCIGQVFGAVIESAPTIMHGKLSAIEHAGEFIFNGIPSPFMATRYHSLAVRPSTISDELNVCAETADGVIMGLRHKNAPLFGVQFHPESIASEHGKKLLANFLAITK